MIYANMMGRLGNQMFIYAFARHLQILNSTQIVFRGNEVDRLHNLNVSPYKYEMQVSNKIGKTPLQYILSVFYGKRAGRMAPEALANFEAKYLELFSKHNLYYCRNGYLPFVCRGGEKNTFATGFFQSERYFFDIREIIKKEFTPKTINKDLKAVAKCIDENNKMVCVSIRLGDYLKHPVHGVCTKEYYIRAMTYMKDLLGNPTFYVSTENPKIIQNMPDFRMFNILYENSDLEDYEKMHLTNQCTHYVLSNSTFSWWGYYLSKNREQRGGLTIAPNRWYKDNTPCDIWMNDWVLIDP